MRILILALLTTISLLAQIRGMFLSYPYWALKDHEQETLARKLSESGVNTVYLSVYSSGITRYNSPVLEANGLALSGNDKKFIKGIQVLRKNHLRVVAWFEGGLSVYKYSSFFKNHQASLTRCMGSVFAYEGDHQTMGFLDPKRPRTLTIMTQAIMELANHPARFKEIMLDRMRYTKDGWGRPCLSFDGTSSPQAINRIVRAIYTSVKSTHPEIILSASPVGSYGLYKFNQNWSDWITGGYLDHVMLQMYIKPHSTSSCKRDAPFSRDRKITLEKFKQEFATHLGIHTLFEDTVQNLNSLAIKTSDLLKKRETVLKRSHAIHPFSKIGIIYRAHDYDDSECVMDQMMFAWDKGFTHTALWASQLKPSFNGDLHLTILDNLELLKLKGWNNRFFLE